jgi:hypothetical protein
MAKNPSIFGRIKKRFTSDTSSEALTANSIFGGRNAASVNDFFGRDVFKEEEMNPHNEMFRVREMIDNNSFVASALSTYQSVFLGDQITVQSGDESTQEWFMENWLPESGLTEAIGNGGAGEHYKGIGNAYYHVKRGTATGMPKEIELISKPENMWIRKEKDGSIKDYVLEVDRGEQGNRVNDMDVETYQVSYGGFERHPVQGIRYDKDEIVHVPQGRGQIPPYGRSDLASASSDEKILREIERSYGIMARHKQVPKVMWILKDRLQDGPLKDEDFDEIKRQINNLNDTDNPILNGNIEAEKIDYSYGGAEIKMQETIDYLKRKVTAGLIPQALIHGDVSRNAISEDQRAVFFQEVRGDRQTHIKAFKPVLKEVVEKAPVGGLSKDVTLEFGELSLNTEQSREQRTIEMWNKGLIDLNEARERLGFSEHEEFQEGPFKWEVQSQPSPETVQQTLKQATGDEE